MNVVVKCKSCGGSSSELLEAVKKQRLKEGRSRAMRYGFIIDQRKCIGCHACTVACKQENGVALGDVRTCVKYTEKGAFPHVERNFLVEQCNHCDDACIRRPKLAPLGAITAL